MNLLPLQIAAEFFFGWGVFSLVLLKVEVGHKVGFDVVYGFTEGVHEFVEVFFVNKKFVFFVSEPPALGETPPFGYGEAVGICEGRFTGEKVSPLAGCLSPVYKVVCPTHIFRRRASNT